MIENDQAMPRAIPRAPTGGKDWNGVQATTMLEIRQRTMQATLRSIAT
jgi:hypothetical protein